MIFEQLPVGDMQNWAYIFADDETREGFVVDPGFDQMKIMSRVKELKVNVTKIILTHHHYDHVSCAKAIKAQTGALIAAHRESQALLRGDAACDCFLDDGDVLSFGKDCRVKILHTPGHAPDSICLVVADKWLVTGDTLFIGDCGRADLPGSSFEELYDSLQRLKKLPDSLIVCPGHDYGTTKSRTLGEEKSQNRTLTCKSLDEFMGV